MKRVIVIEASDNVPDHRISSAKSQGVKAILGALSGLASTSVERADGKTTNILVKPLSEGSAESGRGKLSDYSYESLPVLGSLGPRVMDPIISEQGDTRAEGSVDYQEHLNCPGGTGLLIDGSEPSAPSRVGWYCDEVD